MSTHAAFDDEAIEDRSHTRHAHLAALSLPRSRVPARGSHRLGVPRLHGFNARVPLANCERSTFPVCEAPPNAQKKGPAEADP
jgi:hypothetical protein